MLTYILFIVGFIILIKGADYLVDGASSVAKKLKVSTLVIGLTVVSFGTSAPELLVNIIASIRGATDIAIGNIIGSNISNLLLILGVSAIIYPITVKKGTVSKEIPLSLLAIIVVFLLANDTLIDKFYPSLLTRIDGLILLAFFIIFLYYTYGISKVVGEDRERIPEMTGRRSVLYIILGLIGLTLGGQWVVDGAVKIAGLLGASEAFIGLTIIAIGTSLPELVTSAVAAKKQHADIAIGNIIGSNIFNLFWILGISATIKPINFNPMLNADIIFLVVATILVLFLIFFGRRNKLSRREGVFMLFLYILYIVFLISRG